MTDHTALIEALERAEGPSRELDEAIWSGIGNCNHKRTQYYCIEDGNDYDSGHTCLDCGVDTYGAKNAPTFTASIDAALTLVPDGAGVKIDRYWTASADGPVWMTCIATGGIPDNPRQTFEAWDCSNAAIALVIAALRARSAQS